MHLPFIRTALLFIFFSLLVQLAAAQQPNTWSAVDILQEMKKLNVLGSVLYVAAHPDDENNTLLPYLTKERCYRTAYLSLTRGDGGQNLIGSEQGIELGMIRTQELLAARKIDGSEQYFTRAYEFGFSKTAQETLQIWNREKILEDVVYMIRKLQPDIIITRFPGDARAGHGHHAASSILANEAFKAAADSTQFAHQLKMGLSVWKAKRLLWNNYNFGSNNNTADHQFKIDVGNYNALLGKNYGEIGAEARSMHKSQGEGRPRRRGSITEYFTTMQGDSARNSLMDGVDTTWARLGNASIHQMVGKLLARYDMQQPQKSIAGLVEIYTAIQQLPSKSVWKAYQLNRVQQIIEACSGLFTEFVAPQQQLIQGQTLPVSISINQRNQAGMVLQKIVFPQSDTTCVLQLKANTNYQFTRSLKILQQQPISQPYWLQQPMQAGIFQTPNLALTGDAQNQSPYFATIHYQLLGVDFTTTCPLQYKFTDPAKGELYQPVAVYPAIELKFSNNQYLSVNKSIIKGKVLITNNTTDTIYLKNLNLQLSKQWTLKWHEPVQSLAVPPAGRDVHFSITHNAAANYTETVGVQAQEGIYHHYSKKISYDHIPDLIFFPEAQCNLVALDIKTQGKKIGFLPGAGDKVAESLQALGYQVNVLSETDLNDEHLQSYDALIAGVRAYNLNDYLTKRHHVLMKYVHNGGNLIVQYIRNQLVNNTPAKIGPYPFSVNAKERITNEKASVNFLLPQHPVLHIPNTITQTDFEGWVQERSTYQAETADTHYQKIFSMNDPNEPPTNGSLLITDYGKGNFVYCALSFFRQLPAGVPGAFRLMANLIALPKHE